MIPFTQFVRPDGRRREGGFDRPEEVESKARKFIESGGWFECEVLTTMQISLTACKNVDGEPQDVAIELCANGPGLEEAVDLLVAKAQNYV